ncbi:MAG TPA: aspartate kinase [Planctomycetota bacterium]|nr:aspartate kinase [Planctomycetota bacterium]
MIVLKFGGTSVGGPEPIRRLGEIVRRSLGDRPVVVASAVSGVTNRLFRLADLANSGAAWSADLDALAKVHRDILHELGLDPALVDGFLEELEGLIRGISLIRECTLKTKDYLVSFGERLSVRIVAAHLRKAGIPASAIDAFDAGLVTDSRFGSARPLIDVDERIRSAVAPLTEVPVLTGYIGKDQAGNITTLGRGGSDYSASIFGAALDVKEIQIWTDVDGVMTADPRIVKGARFIKKMSFAEASELAFYGAKVLHPATMIPAVRKNIPIRVLNSYRPEFEGTTIVASLQPPERFVKSIASKDRIAVVNIVAARMIFQYGFLERVAAIFARHEVVIDMIATSEVSLAMTTDPSARLEPVVAEIAEFADVTVKRDMSLVSVVGEELRERGDHTAIVFGVIAGLRVPLEMISYGATRNNLAFVVAQDRVREVVMALHQKLFDA